MKTFLLLICTAAISRAGVLDAPAFNRTIQIGTVLAAYNENELAADAKYKGQTYAIVGVINEITKDSKGAVVVKMKADTSNIFWVNCTFKDPAGVMNLKSGGNVNLRGTIAGKKGSSTLSIENCSLVR